MTEIEAKTKWCPMVHISGSNTSAIFNPDGLCTVQQQGRCIASQCMMWRALPGRTPSGYCGLAGKPSVSK